MEMVSKKKLNSKTQFHLLAQHRMEKQVRNKKRSA